MFRLAHLSDLHLPPLPPVGWSELASKRLLGYLSWRLRRHRKYRREIADALVRDLQHQPLDHVAITGDLTNLALPLEFEQTAAWLRLLGPPETVSLVPGNHDAYVRSPLGSRGLWDEHMTSDPAPPDVGAAAAGGFPFLRRRGPVALIGLSTATPSPPTFATGRLGRAQLGALDRLLATLAAADCFRVVLIHHPPGAGASRLRRQLIDAAELREVIARHGAELVLHGHEHEFVASHIEGPGRPVPVIGVPAASRRDSRVGHGAQYHIFAIEPAASGWRCDLKIRRFSAVTGSFVAAGQSVVLAPEAPARLEAALC